MPPLRILHVTPYYAEAWAYGGIPRVVVTLARALAARRHMVTVCSTDAADARSRLRPRRTDGDVEVRLFPNVSNRLAYHLQLFVPRGFRAWLREHVHEFDVAHLHGCHHLPGVFAMRHLQAAGVPYVLSPHGTGPRIERRRALKWLFDSTLGRGVLERAACVLAVSEAERRQLRGLGVPASRIRLVPNPLDLSEFADPPPTGAFRRDRGLDARPVVLFLGKLTPRKRVDVLVEAMALLPRDDATLVVAGNDLGAGPGLRRLAERRGLGARTIFTGLLRGRERLAALGEADVVVYPSRDEVFGLVPLEAVCSGSPVIVADDSGCAEVIGATGGGLVITQGDPVALARAIGDVLARRDHWCAAAAAARTRVQALYRPDGIAAQVADVYGELLDRTHAQIPGALVAG